MSSTLSKKSLFIDAVARDGSLLVKLSGPSIGNREAPIILEEVMPLLNQMTGTLRFLILDMSDVSFLSSQGLGTCINLYNTARKLGGKSIMVGLNGDLKKMLAIVKLDRLYQIVGSEEELKKVIG